MPLYKQGLAWAEKHPCDMQRCHYGLPGNSAHFPARKGCFSACNRQTPESLEMAQIWVFFFFLINFVLELGEKCEIFI